MSGYSIFNSWEPSMARHVTITDEQILKAARNIFLKEGFSAPTSRIAAAAGVSEGSIFKRFTTKEALFFAALEIPEQPQWHRVLREAPSESAPDSVMREAAAQMILHFLEMFPRMITAVGSRIGSGHSHPFEGMKEPPHKRDRAVLEEFIKSAQAAGTMGPGDAAALSALLLGGIAHHVFISMHSGKKMSRAQAVAIAHSTADALWLGMKPQSKDTVQ
jgi:AcrR family transcriptional regulator